MRYIRYNSPIRFTLFFRWPERPCYNLSLSFSLRRPLQTRLKKQIIFQIWHETGAEFAQVDAGGWLLVVDRGGLVTFHVRSMNARR